MSTITSEFTKVQLIAKAREQIEFCRNTKITGEGRVHVNQCLALFEIALSSLEAEPVAWRSLYYENHGLLTGSKNVLASWQKQGWKCEPLYTAPPVPVSVPDEATPDNIQMLASTYAPRGVTYQWDSDECNAAADSWNACRAAMLQGVDGNSPAHSGCRPAQNCISPAQCGNSPVIPDGWVVCSERMPEVGVKVLCFPVNDEPIHATYNGQVWLQDISWSVSDEPIDNVISCNVTHWMPLPAAPQQEDIIC
ncbi:TPA: DUF551 domain-containing protein [Enterobacter hormaechei]|nr:DUF551 domain-containing protein [Enterobacter hormaechei]